ncbi:unnamed protein product [Lasius platythorax]|uniref:DM2 domain-containing protein n=1 Tax=Lasius platythorax TaxID=488582 RepID=A0AAV2NZT3_9HYME
MEALIKTRGSINGKVTRFKNYINEVIASSPDTTQTLDEIKILEIKERLNRIREVYDKFDEIQLQIELSFDEQETVQYRENFEEEYFHIVAQAERLLTRGDAIRELLTLEEFKDFLSQRANLLETLELNNKGTHNSKRIEHTKSKLFLVQKKGSDSDSDEDWGKNKKAPGSTAKKDDGGKGKGGGYTRAITLSPELAAVVGAEQMAGHEVVKKVWSIIKERNLYDPKDKQYVICDEELMKIIGVQRFRTFGIIEYLKNHFVD